MNELIFFTTFIIMLLIGLFAFRLGKSYVYAFMATVASLMYFMAPMVTDMFGIAFSMSELFYAVLFFMTDLAAEHYGKKDAHGIVWLSVIITVTLTAVSSLSLALTPHSTDFVQAHLKAALNISPRLVIASFVAFIAEQHFDIWLFDRIRRKTNGRKLWLRNIGSTSATQLIDVLVFYPLAFYGVYENLTELMITAAIFKLAMALLDTPFIYLGKKIVSTPYASFDIAAVPTTDKQPGRLRYTAGF